MVRTCCRRHIFDSYFYKAKVSNEIALLEQGQDGKLLLTPYFTRFLYLMEPYKVPFGYRSQSILLNSVSALSMNDSY